MRTIYCSLGKSINSNEVITLKLDYDLSKAMISNTSLRESNIINALTGGAGNCSWLTRIIDLKTGTIEIHVSELLTASVQLYLIIPKFL